MPPGDLVEGLEAGIDEAGRGPLIGPMVVASVILTMEGRERLSRMGVRDSKRLSRASRERLFPEILKEALSTIVVILQPRDLDRESLNTVEERAVEGILRSIRTILGGCPERIYVDLFTTQGRASTWSSICGTVVAEHRADSRYTPTAAASIVAKTLRDMHIDSLKQVLGDFGSGYPSDPRTRSWVVARSEEELRSLSPFIRSKWSTLESLGKRLGRASTITLDRYTRKG